MKTELNSLLIHTALSVSAFGQHDPGRNAVRLLARDETDAAVESFPSAGTRDFRERNLSSDSGCQSGFRILRRIDSVIPGAFCGQSEQQNGLSDSVS